MRLNGAQVLQDETFLVAVYLQECAPRGSVSEKAVLDHQINNLKLN